MDDFRRGPQKENAHRVGSIVKGGACSLESAPISLMLDFLKATQEHDLTNAETRAKETIEPKNELVRDLLAALKQQQALMSAQQSDDESSNIDESDDAVDSVSSDEESDQESVSDRDYNS